MTRSLIRSHEIAFVGRKKLQSLLLSNEIPTYSIFINLTLEILRMLRLQYLERRLYYFLKTNGETNDNRLVKYFVRRVKISYIDSANCFLINFLALEHSSFQKSTMNYSLYRPYNHNFFRRNDAFDICLGFSLASNQIV